MVVVGQIAPNDHVDFAGFELFQRNRDRIARQACHVDENFRSMANLQSSRAYYPGKLETRQESVNRKGRERKKKV